MTQERSAQVTLAQVAQDDPESKHGAVILRGGGRFWAECLCGWVSESTDRGAGAAAIRWANHVRLAYKGVKP